MTCPVIEELERLAMSELDDDSRLRIHDHLTDCEDCSDLYHAVESNLRFGFRLQAAFDRDAERHPSTDPHKPEIDGYEIGVELGRGGMGVVYGGRQLDPSRPVAVKLLTASAASSDYAFRLFRREAEVLARMRHPAIASVIDAGQTRDGRRYFAMELVQGLPLDRYATNAALSPRDRIDLFARICDAVHHAHLRGVLHRDL
ncbi:MAG: protein kinase, partial [Phycisphaerales bacterium]|nr:protein kinase [Phycisphaerales bacterium]